MLLTYTQSYTDTYAGMLRNCRIDLANWSQMAGQTECQRKACLQSFWRGVQARASWGRRGTQWDMLRVRRLHIDHARLRSSAVRLSRCLQTGVSRKEGERERKWVILKIRWGKRVTCIWLEPWVRSGCEGSSFLFMTQGQKIPRCLCPELLVQTFCSWAGRSSPSLPHFWKTEAKCSQTTV